MLVRRAADAQLTVAVVAPAHEAASSHDRARVSITRCDGEDDEAWGARARHLHES